MTDKLVNELYSQFVQEYMFADARALLEQRVRPKPDVVLLTDYCQDGLEGIPVKYPEYTNVHGRLASYSNKWKYHRIQSPRTLSEAGFFFSGPEDIVRCFVCGITLGNWEDNDVPLNEHLRWGEHCCYIKKCLKHPVAQAIVTTALADQSRVECDVSPDEIRR